MERCGKNKNTPKSVQEPALVAADGTILIARLCSQELNFARITGGAGGLYFPRVFPWVSSRAAAVTAAAKALNLRLL